MNASCLRKQCTNRICLRCRFRFSDRTLGAFGVSAAICARQWLFRRFDHFSVEVWKIDFRSRVSCSDRRMWLLLWSVVHFKNMECSKTYIVWFQTCRPNTNVCASWPQLRECSIPCFAYNFQSSVNAFAPSVGFALASKIKKRRDGKEETRNFETRALPALQKRTKYLNRWTRGSTWKKFIIALCKWLCIRLIGLRWIFRNFEIF